MSGTDLPPPSPFAPPPGPDAAGSPALPHPATEPVLPPVLPSSPWARPLEGQAPVEFELRPNAPDAPVAVAARRPWKVAGAIALVAVLALAGVLVAMRSGGSDEEPAAGASELDATVPATSTVPATTAPTAPTSTAFVTIAPPPTTEPEVTTPPTIGPTDVAPGTYDLGLATSSADQPMRMTMSMAPSTATSYQVMAEVDASQRFHMTMDVGIGEPTEMIFDVAGGVGYLKGEAMASIGSGTAEWIAVNLQDMVEMTGQSYEDFVASFNPAAEIDIAGQLGKDPVPLGLTDIDGESVMLYAISLDADEFADAATANPALADNPMLGSLSGLSSVEYRLYVTDDNRLRRMEMDMDMNGVTMPFVIDVLPVAPDFEVALPDQADVELIDVTQLD